MLTTCDKPSAPAPPTPMRRHSPSRHPPRLQPDARHEAEPSLTPRRSTSRSPPRAHPRCETCEPFCGEAVERHARRAVSRMTRSRPNWSASSHVTDAVVAGCRRAPCHPAPVVVVARDVRGEERVAWRPCRACPSPGDRRAPLADVNSMLRCSSSTLTSRERPAVRPPRRERT